MTLKTIAVLWVVIAIQAIQLGHWWMLGLAAFGVFAALMDLRSRRKKAALLDNTNKALKAYGAKELK
jgi:hypothetical protein